MFWSWHLYAKRMIMLVTWQFNVQESRHFPKSKKMSVTFYIKKGRHFTLHDFSWKFWSWHVYTKSMTLFVTCNFNIQNPDTTQKSRKVLLIFYIQNPDTLCYAFLLNFWDCKRVGGHFYMQKLPFVLHFYIQKQYTFSYIFYRKSMTICATLLYTNIIALCVTSLYI